MKVFEEGWNREKDDGGREELLFWLKAGKKVREFSPD